MKNKYHISLFMQFKDDCDIDKLETLLGLQAYQKNALKDSVGQNKTAKLWYKTNDYDIPDTYEVLKCFIHSLEEKFEIIKQVNEMYNGKTILTLYFEEVNEKPYIKLSSEDMELLSKNGISFEVDFRL